MCVCVCVCVRERERERERVSGEVLFWFSFSCKGLHSFLSYFGSFPAAVTIVGVVATFFPLFFFYLCKGFHALFIRYQIKNEKTQR